MRPTDLKFRSPKERTPEFYNSTVTHVGTTLSNSPIKTKPSFPKEPRFPQYEFNAKLTGYRVGPGSYEISPIKKKSGPVYKKNHAEKEFGNNGYYYLGNQIVYESSFVPKKQRLSINDDI